MSKFKGQRNAKFQDRTIRKSLPASLYSGDWVREKDVKADRLTNILHPFGTRGMRGI